MPATDRILIVEDDPDIRILLFDLLTYAGYAVVTAANGQQAVDLLENGERPRLMLVDLMLPKVSGTDFLQYMQEDPAFRQIPKIVITAMPRDQVRVVADVVLSKPFVPSAVLGTVQRLLNDPVATESNYA